MQKFSSISIVIVIFAITVNVRGEYNKLELTVHSAPAIDITNVDITPMPIVNPGQAFLTFIANLKRPIKTIQTALKINRAVSGINLPIRCYKVQGIEVGSCTYKDLCAVLKTMLPSFKPQTCPARMAQFGIDCNCPFNIPAGPLSIVNEPLELPDAQSSIANFMATGDFVIQLDAQDQVGPYASLTIKFTVKSQKQSG
ncbi:unnamed protein product [Rotaria sordida]|uniref:Ganglioside GM2 activator n=1 Tax=Rotaria sordida TaxID=392033 RepID=A0A813QIT2_9BILA|nr:unnamed protein product [Rotaria sordida]CAF0780222.1 unnamed protein product [Rotaria sordida]CAF0819421.1 unnamed protein product [Rotaria sordida]CAF3530625.1 unnamed protein product [Rotaria sordida]